MSSCVEEASAWAQETIIPHRNIACEAGVGDQEKLRALESELINSNPFKLPDAAGPCCHLHYIQPAAGDTILALYSPHSVSDALQLVILMDSFVGLLLKANQLPDIVWGQEVARLSSPAALQVGEGVQDAETFFHGRGKLLKDVRTPE